MRSNMSGSCASRGSSSTDGHPNTAVSWPKVFNQSHWTTLDHLTRGERFALTNGLWPPQHLQALHAKAQEIPANLDPTMAPLSRHDARERRRAYRHDPRSGVPRRARPARLYAGDRGGARLGAADRSGRLADARPD